MDWPLEPSAFTVAPPGPVATPRDLQQWMRPQRRPSVRRTGKRAPRSPQGHLRPLPTWDRPSDSTPLHPCVDALHWRRHAAVHAICRRLVTAVAAVPGGHHRIIASSIGHPAAPPPNRTDHELACRPFIHIATATSPLLAGGINLALPKTSPSTAAWATPGDGHGRGRAQQLGAAFQPAPSSSWASHPSICSRCIPSMP